MQWNIILFQGVVGWVLFYIEHKTINTVLQDFVCFLRIYIYKDLWTVRVGALGTRTFHRSRDIKRAAALVIAGAFLHLRGNITTRRFGAVA